MKFYLVRHGDKERIAKDPPLNKMGLAQAKSTAKYFKNIPVKKIYASPLRRAIQTAEIIAKEKKLGVNVDRRLIERMEWEEGVYSAWEDFTHDWDKTDLNPNYKPKKGDSVIETGERVAALVKELSRKYKNENIILVTHGGAIVDVLRNLFTEDELKKFNKYFVEFTWKIIKECSITKINFQNGKFSLEDIGYVGHSKIYKLHLNDRPFEAIKAGTKKVEGRTNTPWDRNPYSNMKKGDQLIFHNSKGEEIKTKVLYVYHYKNVRDMLEKEGVENVLSSEPKTIEHGIESYNSLEGYKEAIKKNGIYAIGIKPL